MLTHTEFFYEVWAEKIRSKPIPPYVRVPEEVSFGSFVVVDFSVRYYIRTYLYPRRPRCKPLILSFPSATHIFTAAAMQNQGVKPKSIP